MKAGQGPDRINIAGKPSLLRQVKFHWQLYVILLLPICWLIVFRYLPMYGVQIAFRNFNASEGMLGSDWVGLKWFLKFFSYFRFTELIRNTLTLSVYSLVAGFPFSIILALALNCTKHMRFKKTVQIVTYMPYFISAVVLCGMVLQFLSPKTGLIGILVRAAGGEFNYDWMAIPEMFPHIYVWSGIWQNSGWGTIIYLAALATIDPQLHEAAMIDGANRIKRVWHIDLPGILPTAIIVLIISTGGLMSVGFEKAFLLQNNLNINTSEIISTFVYKIGLASTSPNYSYGAAIGLFNSMVNLILLSVVNHIAKRTSDISLW